MTNVAPKSWPLASEIVSTDSLLVNDGEDGSTPGAGNPRRLLVSTLTSFLATATLAAGTLTASAPMVLSQTWNEGSTTFVGASVDITDTASAADSLVQRWRVDGSNVMAIDKSGNLLVSSGVGFGTSTSNQLRFVTNNFRAIFSSFAFFEASATDDAALVRNSGAFAWSSSNDASGSPDTRLHRDGAGIVNLRNGANAQELRVTGTYTDGSNYEWLSITPAGITVETAGTGTDNIDLTLTAAGTGSIVLGSNVEVASGWVLDCGAIRFLTLETSGQDTFVVGSTSTDIDFIVYGSSSDTIFRTTAGEMSVTVGGILTQTAILDAATGDEAAFTLNYTTNKATSGNDTGLLISMTDTASPGTSKPLDVQVGGSSVFSIQPTNSGSLHLGPNTSSRIYTGYTGFQWIFQAHTSNLLGINAGFGVQMLSTMPLAWGGTIGSSGGDLTLYRDAADTLALRRSTNAQTFNIYNTYTDASNYERLAITGSAITVETAGTGTDNIDLTLTSAGVGDVVLAAGASTLTVDGSTSGQHNWTSDGSFPTWYFNRGATGVQGLIALSSSEVGMGSYSAHDLSLRRGNSTKLTLGASTLTVADAYNIVLNGTTGTKIGTATSQKLGFWNATPVVQPTTGIAEASFVENAGGTAVNVDSTFGGYTLQQVTQALQTVGILA